jgi:hypothetical protein
MVQSTGRVQRTERIVYTVDGKTVLTQRPDGKWQHGYEIWSREECEVILLALVALDCHEPLSVLSPRDNGEEVEDE